MEDISDKAITYFHTQYRDWLAPNIKQKEADESNRTQMIEAAKISYQKQLRKAEGDCHAQRLPPESDASPSAPVMM